MYRQILALLRQRTKASSGFNRLNNNNNKKHDYRINADKYDYCTTKGVWLVLLTDSE